MDGGDGMPDVTNLPLKPVSNPRRAPPRRAASARSTRSSPPATPAAAVCGDRDGADARFASRRSSGGRARKDKASRVRSRSTSGRAKRPRRISTGRTRGVPRAAVASAVRRLPAPPSVLRRVFSYLNWREQIALTLVNSGFKKEALATVDSIELGQVASYCNVLARFPNLRKLKAARLNDLSHCDDFAKGLVTCSQLRKLDLAGSRAGMVGSVLILDAMSALSSLEHIDLSGNNMKRLGAQQLSEVLSRLPRLHTLVVRDNAIGHHGTKKLISAAAACPLKSLDLSGNRLSQHVEGICFDLLPRLTKLETLCMNDNLLKPKGAKALAKSLGGLTRLRRLSLAGNEIGQTGSTDLAKLFGVIPLEHLDLSENWMGSAGIAVLMAKIASATTLQTLKVTDNNADAAFIEELRNTMPTGTQLSA